MSIRENIEIFYQFDIEAYLEILKTKYGATAHPAQSHCYLVESLPFYEPKWIEDHVSILGFNYAPLSILLIGALTKLPELVPDEVSVVWTLEQELILATTMSQIRNNLQRDD